MILNTSNNSAETEFGRLATSMQPRRHRLLRISALTLSIAALSIPAQEVGSSGSITGSVLEAGTGRSTPDAAVFVHAGTQSACAASLFTAAVVTPRGRSRSSRASTSDRSIFTSKPMGISPARSWTRTRNRCPESEFFWLGASINWGRCVTCFWGWLRQMTAVSTACRMSSRGADS